MNTPTATITEASIADFLRDALSAISAHHGIKFNAVAIHLNEHGHYVSLHSDEDCEIGQKTVVDAASTLAAKQRPAEFRAAAMRDRAASLLARAEAIYPQPSVAAAPATKNEEAPAL